MIAAALGRGLTSRTSCARARSLGSGNASKVARRRMGGGQPESQSMKAELFGGHEKDTGWEGITYFTYGATVLLLGVVANAPESSITTWASEEARMRLKLKAEGKVEKFEFGVHYNVDDVKYNYESKFPDNPFDEDLDDDDDEEDDDEEEEEEEEE